MMGLEHGNMMEHGYNENNENSNGNLADILHNHHNNIDDSPPGHHGIQ